MKSTNNFISRVIPRENFLLAIFLDWGLEICLQLGFLFYLLTYELSVRQTVPVLTLIIQRYFQNNLSRGGAIIIPLKPS